MRGLHATALVLLMPLTACTTSDVPMPIALSFPYGVDQELGSDRYRHLARRVAGAYVRVLVYEKGHGRDVPSRTVVNGASGTIVDPRGFIVTAAHIAKDRRYAVEVTTTDGRVHQATIVDVAPARELALLKIDSTGSLDAAICADSRSIRAGQPVLGIGTPNNELGVVSFGYVTKARRTERITYAEYGYDDAIELEMVVEPGHSGGPVFDTDGHLIGVLASFGLGSTRRVPYISTRLAYAIPASAVAAYLAETVPP